MSSGSDQANSKDSHFKRILRKSKEISRFAKAGGDGFQGRRDNKEQSLAEIEISIKDRKKMLDKSLASGTRLAGISVNANSYLRSEDPDKKSPKAKSKREQIKRHQSQPSFKFANGLTLMQSKISSSSQQKQNSRIHNIPSMFGYAQKAATETLEENDEQYDDSRYSKSQEFGRNSDTSSVKTMVTEIGMLNLSDLFCGNGYPPLKSLMWQILHLGIHCSRTMKIINYEFLDPILLSDSFNHIFEELNFSVEEVVMPLQNISLCLSNLENLIIEEVLVKSKDEAIRIVVSFISPLATNQLARNLRIYIDSFSKLLYLYDLMLSTKSKRGKGFSFTEEDLAVPVNFLSNLEEVLIIFKEVLSEELEHQKYLKFVIVVEEILRILSGVMSLDSWHAMQRRTIIDLNKALVKSVDRGAIPDILDSKVRLVYTGTFQRSITFTFMQRLKTFQFYLFSNVLIWTSPTTGRFKGSLMLHHDMIVESLGPQHPTTVVVKMLSSQANNNKIEFVGENVHSRNLLMYFLIQTIASLPTENVEMDRVISSSGIVKSFNVSKESSSKQQNDRLISRPFNVQHTKLINFNMEWQGDPEDEIKLISKIGSGGFGSVYKSIHIKSGIEMASKLVIAQNEHQENSIRSEIELLKACNHPNIVTYYGCAGPDKKGQLWILMDFCKYGSFSAIHSSFRRRKKSRVFSEAQISHVLGKTLLALIDLHRRRIIHRDIKSGNILLSSKGDVKLADFGVSKQLSVGIQTMNKGIVGSAHWLPPEALGSGDKADQDERKPVGEKGDVWSLGITAIELAEGFPPNHECQPIQAMLKTLSDPPPSLPEGSDYSDLFRDFIRFCLVKDPAARPSASQALQHPFILQEIKGNVSTMLLLIDEIESEELKKVPKPLPPKKVQEPEESSRKKTGLQDPNSDNVQSVKTVKSEVTMNSDTFIENHTIIFEDEDSQEMQASDDEAGEDGENPFSQSADRDLSDDAGDDSDFKSGEEFDLDTHFVSNYDTFDAQR